MKQEELENKIKERLIKINPPEELFDKTISQIVTKQEFIRNNSESKSNFYKLIISNFMDKKLLIGVPSFAIIVFVLVVLFGFNGSKEDTILVDNSKNDIVQQIDNSKNDVAKQLEKEDLSSVDSIALSFIQEVGNEESLLLAENEDTSYLLSRLEDYNNIKTYVYEE